MAVRIVKSNEHENAKEKNKNKPISDSPKPTILDPGTGLRDWVRHGAYLEVRNRDLVKKW
jgi:hypothetical protein